MATPDYKSAASFEAAHFYCRYSINRNCRDSDKLVNLVL